MLERLFKLREHNTTVGVEVTAGLATFLTAAYILVANPAIQSHSGMPVKALFTATAVAIIIGTLLIGLYANMPFILAPGMGINVYFAYSVVGGKGFTWQEALTAILLSGLLFALSSLFGLREALLRCFPEPLKHAMTVSLGFMIAVIGLKGAGVFVFGEKGVSLGDVTAGPALIAFAGILITGAFLALRLPGAVLWGIVAATALGMLNGVTEYQKLAETGALSLPPSLSPIAFAFSFEISLLRNPDFWIVVVTFLAIDIFDSLGTFIGVLNHFDGDRKKAYEARVPRALMCDAVATIGGACAGASTVTTFVESSTGIAAGGRTGLVSLTIVALVGAALFASPLFLMVPAAATAPALLVVGMNMMGLSRRIAFDDVGEGLPCLVMILVTGLTMSISDGLMFGWIGYVLFKLIARKFDELNAGVIAVGVFFLLRLVYL